MIILPDKDVMFTGDHRELIKTAEDRAYRLDALRTYVSALLSIGIIGAVITAQFTLGVETAGPLTGWGGAVIGYWLGARSSGGNGHNGRGRF